MKINIATAILLLCFIFSSYTSKSQSSVTPSPTTENKINVHEQAKSMSNDFDFLLGEWNVISKHRKERLNNNNEWIEATATCKVWKQLDGMLVIDEFYNLRNGKKQVSSTLRIYNSNKKEWTLYWLSTAFPDMGLLPQVKGSFKNGKGLFLGEEGFKGKRVKLRYIWNTTESGTPHWEQAYFDEKNNEWETNWTMDFVKKE